MCSAKLRHNVLQQIKPIDGACEDGAAAGLVVISGPELA